MSWSPILPTLKELLDTDILVYSRIDINSNFVLTNQYANYLLAGPIQLATEIQLTAGDGKGAITPELLSSSTTPLTYPLRSSYTININNSAHNKYLVNKEFLDVHYVKKVDNSGAGVPVGTLLSFAGVNAPIGYIICDGREVLKTEYIDLFAVINTTYNIGDEEISYFRVPNLQGRVPIGAGEGEGLSMRNLGDDGGEEDHLTTIAEMPSHNHDFRHSIIGDWGSAGNGIRNDDEGSRDYSTLDAGGDLPHNNMQPFIVTNYIIKA